MTIGCRDRRDCREQLLPRGDGACRQLDDGVERRDDSGDRGGRKRERSAEKEVCGGREARENEHTPAEARAERGDHEARSGPAARGDEIRGSVEGRREAHDGHREEEAPLRRDRGSTGARGC